jgi:hypothetical protein
MGENALSDDSEFLLGTISGMEEVVQDCVRDLLFYLDEVEVSAWKDRKSKKVVVPTVMVSQVRQFVMELTATRSTLRP